MLTNKQATLPKSSDGMVIYKNGASVSNPYTGEKIELNNIELSLYDLIKGAEICRKWEVVQDGLDWFKANNVKAYMALLD